MVERNIPAGYATDTANGTGEGTPATLYQVDRSWVQGETVQLLYDALPAAAADDTLNAGYRGDPPEIMDADAAADDVPRGIMGPLTNLGFQHEVRLLPQAQVGDRRFSPGIPLVGLTARFNATKNLLELVRRRMVRYHRRLPIGNFAFRFLDNRTDKWWTSRDIQCKIWRRRTVGRIPTTADPVQLEINMRVVDVAAHAQEDVTRAA